MTHRHRFRQVRVENELLNEIADMYVAARRARPVRFPLFCCYLDDILKQRRPDLYELATQRQAAKRRKTPEMPADDGGD